MATDSQEASDTTIKCIQDLVSFLKDLDNSSQKLDENVGEFKRLLRSLPQDQIDAHKTGYLETILHIAAWQGIVWAAEILLDAHASVSEKNFYGRQPLHVSCETGNLSLVRLLLDREADIEARDDSGWSPLHCASMEGHTELVRLLLDREADIEGKDGSGWSPLHYASNEGRIEVAELLLKSGARIQATDNFGRTPLHIAARSGYTDFVEFFLKKLHRSYIDIPESSEKMTALHLATMKGHEQIVKLLLDAGAKIDVKSKKGWTPLMVATKWKYLSCMQALLNACKHDEVNTRDNEGKTPLSVAIEDENLEGVYILLGHMSDKDKCDTNIYQRLLLYETPSPNEKQLDMQIRIQESILDALGKVEGAFDNALLWAAANFDRHKIAKELLIQNLKKGDQQSLSQSSVIELATIQQKAEALWWLVATSPRNSEIMRNIEAAKEKAQNSKKEAQQGIIKDTARKAGGKRRDKVNFGEDNDITTPSSSGNEPITWRHMMDILQDPPLAQEYEDSTALTPPRLKPNHFNSVTGFEATIAQFYKAKRISSIIRRARDLKDIIYGKGPMSIMAKTISDLKDIMNKSSREKEERSSSRGLRATYDDGDLAFTYIHLPATNMDWMKDLLLKIVVDENLENAGARHREISSFLQSTWFEIPDRTSESRFMRPQFVERRRIVSTNKEQIESSLRSKAQDMANQEMNDDTASSQTVREQETPKEEKEQEKDHFIPSSALYMPFLSFATQTKMHECNDAAKTTESKNRTLLQASPNKSPNMPLSMEQKLSTLNKNYKDSVLHNSATLDEAYYHFDLRDDPTLRERNRRNCSQVVTKQLHPELKDSPKDSWTLLRVNQIWIWTLEEKWVISATSHPVDDIEQSWLDGFNEYLNKRIEAGAQSQPGSVEDMVKMMVNYCVGFYERRRTFRNRNNDGWETGLSIRQLFSNYINFIGRGETKLFTEFQNLRNGTNTFERKEKFKGAISKAQQLFGEIKDIRDELGIIKSIVDYQFDVQQKLSKKDPRDLGFASGHFLKDIAEMESLASRIQNAVHSTLSLLQSEISNFQAEESVKQGNNMMVFTLTTAVFLPLSFLTSLFALDVETFQRTPAWAFGIIFGTAFAFTALLIYYVFDFISYALGKSKPFRKYTKKQYDKHIKKRYRDIKPFAERINKRHSPVKDEEKGTQKNGLSDVLD